MVKAELQRPVIFGADLILPKRNPEKIGELAQKILSYHTDSHTLRADLANKGYFLCNVLDPNIVENRCTTIYSLSDGLVMQYEGRNHTRLFMLTDEFRALNFTQNYVSQLKRGTPEFRVVFREPFSREGQVKLHEICKRFDFQDKSFTTRMTVDMSSNFLYPKELDPSLEMRTLIDNDIDLMKELFCINYPGNSFREETVTNYGLHRGIFTKNGELVAMAGVSGACKFTDFNGKDWEIYLLADTVRNPDPSYKGLGQTALASTCEEILKRVKDMSHTLIICDATNFTSEKMCRKLGFIPISRSLWFDFTRNPNGSFLNT